MSKYKIYFKGEDVFKNLSDQTVEEMVRRRYLVKVKPNEYKFEYQKEYSFLFSSKMSLAKVLVYLRHIDKQDATCEDCQKKLSFHIRPSIENGVINFKGIVCVCKSCRTKKLEKEDILIPQFRKDWSYEGLTEEVKELIRSKYDGQDEIINSLIEDRRFVNMKRKELKLYSLSKIVLPPLKSALSEKKPYAFIRENLDKVGISSMKQKLDLTSGSVRVKTRKFLIEENNACPCCGLVADINTLTIEHIQPKSKGGSNTLENLIGMCEPCNKEKADKTVMEFLQVKRFNGLTYRILRIAYKEKDRIIEEYNSYIGEVNRYEDRKVREIKRKMGVLS